MRRALVLCLAAISTTAYADGLSVRLLDARAVRNGTEWIVALDVELNNGTGAPIVGETNFSSVLDGTSLVIVDASGRVVLERSYVHHQSPYSQGQPISLPAGRSVQHIGFPIEIALSRGMRVRLQGSVAGRPDVPIRTAARRIALP